MRDRTGKGSRTYVPEYKVDFALGPIPTPLRRSTVSTEWQSVLGRELSRIKSTGELAKKSVAILATFQNAKGLDMAGRTALIAAVKYLLRKEDDEKLAIKEAGPSTNEGYWRPLLVMHGSYKTHFARAAPMLIDGMEGGKKQYARTILTQAYKKLVSPKRATIYEGLTDEEIEQAMLGIRSMSFQTTDHKDRCSVCVYSTLCGEWGFI